jgi:hypothetical protein
MFFILKKNEKKFGTFKKACIFVSNKNKYIMRITYEANKTVTVNGEKIKANFKTAYSPKGSEHLGKTITYKYYLGSEKVVATVNSLIKKEEFYIINDVVYVVYNVYTNKTNRNGFLVSGFKLEYNGKNFTSDKKLIESILS